MKTRVIRLALFLCSFALLIVACREREKMIVPEPTPGTTPSQQTTISPTLIELQRDYEKLLSAHNAMTEIWADLADGQPVRCGSLPPLVMPESINAPEDEALKQLADHLRQAAIELDRSVSLWRAECANPRANPEPHVIREGRLTAASAADALRAAEPLLSAIQG